MKKVFVPSRFIYPHKRQILIQGDSFHHLVHVLRKQKGSTLEVFDNESKTYRVCIDDIQKDRAVLEILEVLSIEKPNPFFLTLATGILKGKRMNWLLQKVTEVGVHTIVPLVTQRTIARPGERGADKAEKWIKVVVEAAEQCGRISVPKILLPVGLEEFLSQEGGFDAKLLASEEPGGPSLKSWISGIGSSLKKLGRPPHVLLLVGPEGGFDLSEMALAEAKGFTTFHMRGPVLRSETAAMITCALVSYELENL